MATTTLIFENIVIGCFTWTWMTVLLFRTGVVTIEHLRSALSSLSDNTAPWGVLFLLVVYPVGSMMNTLCFFLAKRVFADRQERRILKRFGFDLEDIAPISMYVAQHGSERLYAGIQSFLSFKRISRAAVLHIFILTCALSSFGTDLLPYTLLSAGIFVLAIPAYVQSYGFRNEELMAAYGILQGRVPVPLTAALARDLESQAASGGSQPIVDTAANEREITAARSRGSNLGLSQSGRSSLSQAPWVFKRSAVPRRAIWKLARGWCKGRQGLRDR